LDQRPIFPASGNVVSLTSRYLLAVVVALDVVAGHHHPKRMPTLGVLDGDALEHRPLAIDDL